MEIRGEVWTGRREGRGSDFRRGKAKRKDGGMEEKGGQERRGCKGMKTSWQQLIAATAAKQIAASHLASGG